jgi:hypothetical protein
MYFVFCVFFNVGLMSQCSIESIISNAKWENKIFVTCKKAELNIFFPHSLSLSKLSFNNLQKLNCRTDSVNRDILWNLIVLIDDHFPRDSSNRGGGLGGRRGGSPTPDDAGVTVSPIRAMWIQNTPLISNRTSKIQIWNASSHPLLPLRIQIHCVAVSLTPAPTPPPVPCCEVS